MKLCELDDFIENNELMTAMPYQSGIYAITIDERIAYIGQSKDMYSRCRTHIYNIQNAAFQGVDKKYKLLLAAQMGGHKVDCMPLITCDNDELAEQEDRYIERFMPPLNILTPLGKQDINNLTIFDLKDKLIYQITYIKENEYTRTTSIKYNPIANKKTKIKFKNKAEKN